MGILNLFKRLLHTKQRRKTNYSLRQKTNNNVLNKNLTLDNNNNIGIFMYPESLKSMFNSHPKINNQLRKLDKLTIHGIHKGDLGQKVVNFYKDGRRIYLDQNRVKALKLINSSRNLIFNEKRHLQGYVINTQKVDKKDFQKIRNSITAKKLAKKYKLQNFNFVNQMYKKEDALLKLRTQLEKLSKLGKKTADEVKPRIVSYFLQGKVYLTNTRISALKMINKSKLNANHKNILKNTVYYKKNFTNDNYNQIQINLENFKRYQNFQKRPKINKSRVTYRSNYKFNAPLGEEFKFATFLNANNNNNEFLQRV